MNNELNHLENYEEFSGLVHEKGSSPVALTTNQFLEQLKIENPRWYIFRYNRNAYYFRHYRCFNVRSKLVCR